MTLTPRTIDETISQLPRPEIARLPSPRYATAWDYRQTHRYGLAVESMKRHMTDEGHQLFAGLEHAGYQLFGKDIGDSLTDVEQIITGCSPPPQAVVVQDKREHEGLTADRSQDPEMRFTNIWSLRDHDDIFRVTVLKDAHQHPSYHREALGEMGAHATICYYAHRIVAHLAPYVRPQHLIRTWHTIDKDVLPPWRPRETRNGCLLSGAVSSVYPLRRRLINERTHLPITNYLPHPGYHRNGCHTPAYLHMLSKYRVAICTTSTFGYALRKNIESSAVGCKVITDLPVDDVLPEIDDNLVRINPGTPTAEVGLLIRKLNDEWDEEKQRDVARRTIDFYDFKKMGVKLADDIEKMRRCYAEHM